MTVADLLDGAFKLFKANLRTLVLVVAAIAAPVALLSGFLQRDFTGLGGGSPFSAATQPFPDGAPTAADGVGFGVSVLLSLLVTPLVAGGVARVVGASYLGAQLEPGPVLRATLRRAPALVALWLVVHLVEGVGALLCLLPGLVFMAFFVVAAPALVVEDLGPLAAMSRSWSLVARRFWPVLGVAILSGLVATMVGNVVALVPTVGAVFAGRFAWVLAALGTVLGQLVTQPLVTIVATLVYFDLRIRHEGFDLAVMAADLGGPTPGPQRG